MGQYKTCEGYPRPKPKTIPKTETQDRETEAEPSQNLIFSTNASFRHALSILTTSTNTPTNQQSQTLTSRQFRKAKKFPPRRSRLGLLTKEAEQPAR